MCRSLVGPLRAALAVGLLVLLWRVADGAAALDHLAHAHPVWLGAALAALTAQTVLSALRWRLTAARLGIVLDRPTALREYYLAQVVNQVLPGGVLGDAGRAVRARGQAGLIASAEAVLFERLAGQVGLCALFGVALVGTLAVPGGLAWETVALPAPPLWLGSALALVLLVPFAGSREPVRRGRLGRGAAALADAFMVSVAAPEVRTRQVLLSLSTAICNVAAFAFCAAAVGLFLPPATALVLVPLVLFAMLVPVSVAGWGLREGAAVALLPVAGASAAEGLAASVAFGLVVLAAALPGLLAVRPGPGAGTEVPGPGDREPPPMGRSSGAGPRRRAP